MQRMCDAIVHRGPDDEGFFSNGKIGLGMRRLSIIDLASGQQPMFNEARNVAVVQNGEIYNFLEFEIQTSGARPPLHLELRHRSPRPRLRGVWS